MGFYNDLYIYIYIRHISEGSLVMWKAMGEQEVTGASTDINVEKEREREREITGKQCRPQDRLQWLHILAYKIHV